MRGKLLFILLLPVLASAQVREIDSIATARGLAPFTVKLLIAHARVESGNFTNNLTTKYNNLFGMKHPRQRPTMSVGPVASAEGR